MIYLSQFYLNLRDPYVLRDLNDCHQFHRTIMKLFPNGKSNNPREEFSILFRIEKKPLSGYFTALIQSKLKPDWNQLPQRYLEPYPPEAHPLTKEISPKILNSIQSGEHYRFRLRANPTKKIPTISDQKKANHASDPKENGKRVALYRIDDQIQWLKRHAHSAGFKITSLEVEKDSPNLMIQPQGEIVGYKKTPANIPEEAVDKRQKESGQKSRKITLYGVIYNGYLEVVNPSDFIRSMTAGIGSGKAYGFGLLSIAPVKYK